MIAPRPVTDVIDVDTEVRCCPIDTLDFVHVLQTALLGKNRMHHTATMCGDCNRNENNCFYGEGTLCLGLVTTAGCGASCPSLGRPCNGCPGLSPDANLDAARTACGRYGLQVEHFNHALEMFNQTDPAINAARQGTATAATEISVDHIARVEGHGDIRLVLQDGQVTTCEMAVVEPARLFESMVRGRSFEEVPYIASRVCGICSSSHVVTDLRAIEQVFGVEVTDRTEALRELLLYGSYLQNHGTHLFVFAAPDFLGHKSVFPLAEGNPALFERALGLKALGNELCTLVGGPGHPSHHGGGGGFTHEISADEYLRLAEAMDATRGFAFSQRRSVPRLRHRGCADGGRPARHGGA